MASQNSRIILNITERTYFEYSENYEITLATLFEKNDLNGSRWNSADKIVFVPENEKVKQYVKYVYEKIFP